MNEAFQFTKIIIRKVTTTIATFLAIFIIIISSNKIFQVDGVDADPLVEKEYCQWGKLNISCSPSHVIIIESAIYGRVRVGKCIRDLNKVHNCSWNVGELTDWLCSGRVGCYFDVAQFSMWGVQPCSQELTSNLYIQYRCVQGVVVVDDDDEDGNGDECVYSS
ncbi:hypothetical protein HELRODRAFT_180894 [Helobdella robusta]|uniref:SUEL-type lectin domain-containing protein n=1 Tax=Helobdella robusta TaxID=6412 RepID=T1FGD7_HELRO|nr:hypothetical protein HELRODRAFT_180894 [Helobdella robusta]ESN93575.1 hypothetical protein HELRODRAFT_180894 [Helobdella robusta]